MLAASALGVPVPTASSAAIMAASWTVIVTQSPRSTQRAARPTVPVTPSSRAEQATTDPTATITGGRQKATETATVAKSPLSRPAAKPTLISTQVTRVSSGVVAAIAAMVSRPRRSPVDSAAARKTSAGAIPADSIHTTVPRPNTPTKAGCPSTVPARGGGTPG